jgi:hypothetical protein
MPKRLLDRVRPDTIREFRLAAAVRMRDGDCLVATGQRTAAIYLWGYAVEMTLKAAYFSFIGLPENQILDYAQFHKATTDAIQLQIQGWPKSGMHHKLGLWGQLLVDLHAVRGPAYPNNRFGQEVLDCVDNVWTLWRETLRYRANQAYDWELNTVQRASRWLVSQSHRL